MLSLTVQSYPAVFEDVALSSYVMINTKDYLSLFGDKISPSFVNIKQFVYRVVPDHLVDRGTIYLNAVQRRDIKAQIGGKVPVIPIKPVLLEEKCILKKVHFNISYLNDSYDKSQVYTVEEMKLAMFEYFTSRFITVKQNFIVQYGGTRFTVQAICFEGKNNTGLCTKNTEIEVISDTVNLFTDRYVVFDYDLLQGEEKCSRQQLKESEVRMASEKIKNNLSQRGYLHTVICVDGENLRLFFKCVCDLQCNMYAEFDFLNILTIDDGLCLQRTAFEEIDEDDFGSGMLAERELYEVLSKE